MAEHRDAGVDPRFDPQFQRGYDPARHGRPPRVAGPAEAPRPEAPAPLPAQVEVPNDRAVPDPKVSADDLEPPRRNPFRLVLLLVSIACVGGAALLFWRRLSDDPYGGAYGPDIGSTFAYTFTDVLMVPLLTGGLLGVCLWLALGALRRRDDG